MNIGNSETFFLAEQPTRYELLWACHGNHALFRRDVQDVTQFPYKTVTDYVVSDGSHLWPHESEDGVLKIDTTRVFEACLRSKGVRTVVPVLDTDGDSSTIDTHINMILTLKQHVEFSVSVSTSLELQVRDLMTLFPAIFEKEPSRFSQLDRDEKHRIITNMLGRNCGHFMTKLGEAWFSGDSTNRAKLESQYGERFLAYQDLA